MVDGLPERQSVVERLDGGGQSGRSHGRILVLEAIRSRPGLSKTDLCNRTGLAWGTIWYHVRNLISEGEVVNLAGRGKVHLLPANTDLDVARRIVTARDQHAAAILNVLQKRRRLGLLALADAIETTPRVARRRLEQLVSAGLVTSLGTHRPVYELDSPALAMAPLLEAIPAFPTIT